VSLGPDDRTYGRWQLASRLPSRDAVERWRAVATDTGEPAEILLLPPQADERSRNEFQQLHEALRQARDPALAQTFEVRQEGTRRLAVRAALETPTLDALRGPLDSPVVAWLGAVLLPAVLAAGPATRGALRAGDIGIDARGNPVLAPWIEPLTRVALGSTRAVAPECFEPGSFEGRPPDGAAGLYGLGVLLYTLATGREPPTIGTRSSRAPPPPPSALRHGIPEQLDRAILRLMSPSPGERAGALPWLQELAGPAVDLRTLLRSSIAGPASVEVKTTVSATRAPGGTLAGARGGTLGGSSSPPRAEEAPGGLVLVSASSLAGLDPAARSLIAALARLPIATVDALANAGLPVVLETRAGRGAAMARAIELARTTGLPVEHGSNTTVPAWVWLVTALVASALPAGIGAVMLLMGLIPVAVVAFVVAGLGVGAGALVARSAGRPRALHRAGTQALLQAQASVQERDAQGWLAPQWGRVATLRLQLAQSDLPLAAAADLRGALKDIEARLQKLAEAGQTADRTLRQVDLTALRTKLATLQRRAEDPQVRAERDRLARTVADLEVVEATRTRLASEAASVDALLAEIGAALGQAGPDMDEVALDRLSEVARSAARLPVAVAPVVPPMVEPGPEPAPEPAPEPGPGESQPPRVPVQRIPEGR
jgi:hypothetical protein